MDRDLVGSMSPGEANEMLAILLTNLRNTLSSLGPSSPQALSVRATLHAFLQSMRRHGYATDLTGVTASLAPSSSSSPGSAVVGRVDGMRGPSGLSGEALMAAAVAGGARAGDGGSGRDLGEAMDVDGGGDGGSQGRDAGRGRGQGHGADEVDALIEAMVGAMVIR